MKKQLLANIRFDEREHEFKRMQQNSQHITYNQIDQILNGIGGWHDYTFKFFSDGTKMIINNTTELEEQIDDLKGACYDFYVRQRIDFIKVRLTAQIALAEQFAV